MSKVFELNQIAAYDKGLNLGWVIDEKIPEVMKSDEHRVTRILINLIGNALKFTSKGHISLSVRLIQKRARDYIIQFKLQDTGIGIPVEKQTTLYEKFNRLIPSNRGLYPGAGLGLRIVKKFVEELKGEISVNSEPNQGTIFYVDIPFEKALVETIYKDSISEHFANCINSVKKITKTKLTSTASSDDSLAIKNRLKALFIEDNPAAMKVGILFLRSIDYDVTVATDVKSALKTLNESKFDFVVSDIGLPDGTGIDIIKEIKTNANALNFSTPFFALTANADQGTLTEAEKSGFLHVMIKPMQKELIRSLVAQCVSKKPNTPFESITNYPQQITGADLPVNEEDLFKLEQYPLLDVTEGLALLGDESILREILSILITDISQNRAELEQANRDKNWPLMERLAHKVRGGAAYVGTVQMKYACQYLELYHQAGYSKLLEKLYQQLLEVLNETQLHVIKWLKNVN